jgi:hypothetical protein
LIAEDPLAVLVRPDAAHVEPQLVEPVRACRCSRHDRYRVALLGPGHDGSRVYGDEHLPREVFVLLRCCNS